MFAHGRVGSAVTNSPKTKAPLKRKWVAEWGVRDGTLPLGAAGGRTGEGGRRTRSRRY